MFSCFPDSSCCSVIRSISVQHPHSVTVLSRATHFSRDSLCFDSSPVLIVITVCQNNNSSLFFFGYMVLTLSWSANLKISVDSRIYKHQMFWNTVVFVDAQMYPVLDVFKPDLQTLILLSLCVPSGTASTMRRCLTLWTWAPSRSRSSPATTRLLKRSTQTC